MVKHVLYLHALFLLGQTSAQIWNTWPEADVTITKTLTSIHYLCPCDQSASKTLDVTNPWNTWNEELATFVAEVTPNQHAGAVEWGSWPTTYPIQAVKTGRAHSIDVDSRNSRVIALGVSHWRNWRFESSSPVPNTISPIVTSYTSALSFYPNATTSPSNVFSFSTTTKLGATFETITMSNPTLPPGSTTTATSDTFNPPVTSTRFTTTASSAATFTNTNINPTSTLSTTTTDNLSSTTVSTTTQTTTKTLTQSTSSLTTTSAVTSETTTAVTSSIVNPTLTTTTDTLDSSTTTSSTTTSSTQPAASAWTPRGCYTDSVAARTLSIRLDVPGGPLSMTVEVCLQTCAANGFLIAGLEYSQECWCGNSFQNGGGPASDGDAGCNQPCKGNTAEICGGPDRLNIYTFGATR